MSRRGRSGPTISLFSFQDIITSVTAIVTVLTLLLALDLVRQKQSRANDSAEGVSESLTKRAAELEAQILALQSTATTTDDMIREIAATSPAELKIEIAQRQANIAELQKELERLQRQFKDWQLREKTELANQFDLEPIRRQLDQVRRDTDQLHRQRLTEKAENRTVFSLPHGAQKSGWLAVIESERITIAPLGRPERPIVFTRTGLPIIGASAADEFARWIEKEQLTSDYFLLLIRPHATATFNEVEKLLTQKSISHGFDLVGTDQALLHPERGAAL